MSAYHVSPCMYLVDGCLSARRPGLFDFNRWFGVRVLCRSMQVQAINAFVYPLWKSLVRVKIGMSFPE